MVLGLSLYPSPDQANVQLSLPGYRCQVEDGRFVQELLAPPVAPHTAGPAEQTWVEEVPLPLGGFSSQWAPWELESADLASVLLCPRQHSTNPHLHDAAEASSPRHEIFMPVSKRAPAQQIYMSLPCPSTCTQAICAAERAAMGSAVRSRQIQAADLCL